MVLKWRTTSIAGSTNFHHYLTVDVTSGNTTCTSDPTIITVQPLPTDLGADVVPARATQTLDAGTHSSYLWSTETSQTIDITS